MKKPILIRVLGIGTMHILLYLWLVPFIIVPLLGKIGLLLSIFVSVVLSVLIVSSGWTDGHNEEEKENR